MSSSRTASHLPAASAVGQDSAVGETPYAGQTTTVGKTATVAETPYAGLCPSRSAPRSYRSEGVADRFMRRLLGVTGVDLRSGAGAHRTFRISVVISAVRCVITYMLVPILVPLLSLSGAVAAPIGLALCVVAAVNGWVSLRRFWRADHRHRWTYTVFITVVFAILTVATITELGRIGVLP